MKSYLNALALFSLAAQGLLNSPSFNDERDVFVPNPPPAPSNGEKYLCDGIEIVVMKGKSPSEKYFKKYGKYPENVKKL